MRIGLVVEAFAAFCLQKGLPQIDELQLRVGGKGGRESIERCLRRDARRPVRQEFGIHGVLFRHHDNLERYAATCEKLLPAQQFVAKRDERRFSDRLAAAVPPVECLRILTRENRASPICR